MDQKTTIISITDNAADKVKALIAQEDEEDLALRVGVRPGGCSGFQYSIYFDDEINDDDEVIETKGSIGKKTSWAPASPSITRTSRVAAAAVAPSPASQENSVIKEPGASGGSRLFPCKHGT